MAELAIAEGEGQGTVYTLDPSRGVTIGRDPKCAITLAHSKVSGAHAKVSFRNGGWCLEDLDSTNGSFVNGRKVRRVSLVHGDRVKIGAFVLEFAGEEVGREREEPAVLEAAGTAADSQALVEAARRLGRVSERIVQQMGFELALGVGPVGFDLSVLRVFMKINPGTFIGILGGIFLFRVM